MCLRAQQSAKLSAGVEEVRYAHGKRLEGLYTLGINTIQDLIEHYPFRYDDFSEVVRIIDLTLGQKQAVLGTIHTVKGRKTAKGGYLFEVTVTDESGVLKAAWFNQRWLAEVLKPGVNVLLLGKAEHRGGFMNMAAPLYTLVASDPLSGQAVAQHKDKQQSAEQAAGRRQSAKGTRDAEWEADQGVRPQGILPVYHATAEVSSNWLKRLVIEALKLADEPLDPLPPKLRIARGLMSRQRAWHSIHAPRTQNDLEAARHRLAYEQVFWVQLRLTASERAELKGRTTFIHRAEEASKESLAKKLLRLLPFELTVTQQRAIKELCHDMCSSRRMNRLLLGDVGSGKTLVALHALLASAENNWQAAMMAPTEVLAYQYAQSMGAYLTTLGIEWIVLTSALNAAQKKEVRERIASGAVSVVFGTHALIKPDVHFKALSLIVIDEQHRFGVEHRARLIAKNPAADFLSMTATPIPRSLALVLYGTVEVSYLENLPAKARRTTTSLSAAVIYRAYEAIRKALSRGEQAFIVCPLIAAPAPQGEEQENYLDDLANFSDVASLAAAEAELLHLRQQVFPERTIELLTSRVSSVEKQQLMEAFKRGEIDILVSTTVIEVGVDVPRATVMLIHDADRFGLAQLHQLRGRVGRGTLDSQVFLVANKPGEKARERLRQLERYSDGLTLAKADLLERREGDIAGTRQHGAASLSLINVIRDSALIEAAHEDVTNLLKDDPELTQPEHQPLLYELKSRREGRLD